MRFDQISSCSMRRASGRDDVPDVIAVVAEDVAGVLVILPVVERLALVGPLLGAVVTRDDRPVAHILGLTGNHERRPIGGAIAVAARFAVRRIAIPGVERHAFGIDQYLAFRRFGDL